MGDSHVRTAVYSKLKEYFRMLVEVDAALDNAPRADVRDKY